MSSPDHVPGSITIRAKVFIDLLHDICASLHHHGFRRIVLLNGHGGNRSSLEVLGQELFVEFGLTVNTLAYWDVVPDLHDLVAAVEHELDALSEVDVLAREPEAAAAR